MGVIGNVRADYLVKLALNSSCRLINKNLFFYLIPNFDICTEYGIRRFGTL